MSLPDKSCQTHHAERRDLGLRGTLRALIMISFWLVLSGFGAGIIGALLGVGGGILLVPLLTLAFKVPLLVAVAASLVCVIATSSGAAGVYVQEKLCDVRLGTLLEISTVMGALGGSYAVAYIAPEVLQITFAVLLAYVAFTIALRKEPKTAANGEYQVKNYPLGMGVSAVAGALSGALGIGGGPLKVPTMYLGMGVPFKVATATSNFMIGVTAAGSVFLYYQRGQLDMSIAVPTMIGVYVGARGGARFLPRIESSWLKRAFAVLLLFAASQMALRGLHVGEGSTR
jgi:uncharacterized membrane protein YfcA